MNKLFPTFLFFLLFLSLFGCRNDRQSQMNDTQPPDTNDLHYTTYGVFTADNNAVYNPGGSIAFQVMKSEATSVITSKIVDGADIVCIKDNNGDFYAALSDGDYYNCFYQIGSAEYAYPNTPEITEYKGVLGYSGFILSFMTGADHKSILYFYIEEDLPVLLAECDKSNYEIGSDDEGNRKLATSFGSMTSETKAYYFIEGQIYQFNMNSFIEDYFCSDNEIASVRYNNDKEKFLIDIYSKNDFSVVSSMEAYIDGDLLYIR